MWQSFLGQHITSGPASLHPYSGGSVWERFMLLKDQSSVTQDSTVEEERGASRPFHHPVFICVKNGQINISYILRVLGVAVSLTLILSAQHKILFWV